MTRPYQQWPTLWQLFIALDEDYLDRSADEDEAVRGELRRGTDVLTDALAQWHAAFDGASDEEVERIVADFNPSYDPAQRFGGYRQWAEWVREHLERELAARQEA
jgi:hypothetical protein